ncbi:MmcQ/YjbR family DNA-binding protein [Clostridium grantii]|uniref:Predicted DNA-binding protein, MmcQ/YjbR family n=1 Tax=Clostridium grantii DSM 8605 TaxID=1121316 RepID=A0A1M5UY34_9CLOT|nr:MmcQ/YjbR family DNA-binding protein [Clostridium grantii]SHH67768.1 Predicted DNA-binding protein, MmcQ/YjbR family [Clostridium grantii DSM 8605]
MNIEDIEKYCLSKLGAEKGMPFKVPVPVYKVGGKIFGLANIHENRPSINLKNYKEENLILREMFQEVIPGYHMNKVHWNTIYLDGKLDDNIIKKFIDVSYDIVFNSLTKNKQKEVLRDR